MSEKTKTDPLVTPFGVSGEQSSPLEIRSDDSGTEHRLDQPHPPVSSSATPVDQPANGPLRPGAEPVSHSRPDTEAGGQSPQEEQQLLLQASQIAVHLRSQFAELDRREQSLNAQLNELDREQRNVRLWIHESEEDIGQREARLRVKEAELSHRIGVYEKLAGELDEREQTLKQDREALEAERASLRQQLAADLEAERDLLSQEQKDWATRRDAEMAQMQRERQIHDVAVTKVQQELTAYRREQLQSLEREQREQEIRLQNERQEFQHERDAHRHKLQQDRNLFEKRCRFQQEHLHKARHELELAGQTFRHQTQQTRMRFEQTETLLQLRQNQLEHYRALLEEREKSVEREQQSIAKVRRAQQNETDRDTQNVRREREAWEQQRQSQRAEIRRQQDMLALHAENLEGRRKRLDQLRAELEETHRNTLEMRMALEEAWAQLSQAVGDDVARHRVDEARRALAERYRYLREALAQQRRETREAQALFERQKDEFREERQTLTGWVAQRDDKLRLWEEQLRQEAEALNTREAAWRAARDQWMHEKIEAEEVIRDLLRQLTVVNDPNAAPDDTPTKTARPQATAAQPHPPQPQVAAPRASDRNSAAGPADVPNANVLFDATGSIEPRG